MPSTMVDTAAAPPLKPTSRRPRSAVFSDANANAAGGGAGADAPIKPNAKAVASRYLAAFSKPVSRSSSAASSTTATNASGRSASPAPRRTSSAEPVAPLPNKTVTAADACTATTRTLSVAFQSPTYCLDTSKTMRPVSPAAFPPEKRNSGDPVTSSRARVSELCRNTCRWPASGRDAMARLDHSVSNHRRAVASTLAGGGTPHRASVDGGNEYRMRALWASEYTSDSASSGADKTPPGSAGQRPSPRSSSARFSRDIAMGTFSDRFAYPAKPVSSRTPAAAPATSPSPVKKKKKRSLLNGLLSSSPFSKTKLSLNKQQQSPSYPVVGSSFRITEIPFSRPRRSVELPGSFAGKKLQQSKACGSDGDMKKMKTQQKAEEEHQLRLLYSRHLQLRHANAKAAAAHSSKRAAAEKTLYAVWMAILRARKSVAIAKLHLQLLRNNCKLMAILRGQMMYLEEWSAMEGVHADSLSGTAQALNATVARLPVSDGAVADVQALKNAVGCAVDVMQSIAISISTQLSKLAQANILVSHLSGVAIQEFVLMARCRKLLSTLTSMHVEHCSLQGQRIQLNQRRLRRFRWASDNHFTGKIPDYFGSWSNLTDLNLVANNFMINKSTNISALPLGLECLQQNTPCFLGSPQSTSFALDCGSRVPVYGSDKSTYQPDDVNLGPASYYVSGASTWGVSNVGIFMGASNGSYKIHSSRQFQNAIDPELFKTARMSPSSLRFYGVGLANGMYTVTLQFAEFDFEDSQTWKSLGRRVFDIYVQGERKEQNFDIRKAAGGKSYTAIKKQYIVPITRNFIEIHLFWAGKGTCCIPTQGYYGPAISALSVTRMHNQKKVSSKTGVIAGVVLGAAVLGLGLLAAFSVWRHKRRKLSVEQQELYSIVGRPNVASYSYGELKAATKNFSCNNLLGEGGYGSVYKGKLTNGSVVAVKHLSATSHQGKTQFLTEIETISRVQHRNLVRLYGCCLEVNTPLLVYECLENGSLDKALFGSSRLNLDWPTRFGICLGIARGLAYLHEESSIRVVHRDIKASNVLLDVNLNPKISDFGLAKLYNDKKTHLSTKVAGTLGYLAPEYAMRGHMTEKVDVFAFGVVILETLVGRPNYDDSLDEDKAYLLEWVWQLYEENHPLEVVVSKLTEFDREEVIRVIRVALLCIQTSPRQRPSMSRVVSMLAGDIDVAEAVSKPSYITEWQSNSVSETAMTNSGTKLLSSVIEDGR